MKQYEEAIKIIERLNDELFDEGIEDGQCVLYITTDGYEFYILLDTVIMYDSQNEDSELDMEEVLLTNLKKYSENLNKIVKFL